MNEENTTPQKPFRWVRFALMVAAFVGCYFVFFSLNYALRAVLWETMEDAFSFLSLILCGFVLGVVASSVWDPLAERKFRHVLWAAVGAFLCTLGPLVLLAVETVICLVMATPIVVLLISLGIGTARGVVRMRKDRAATTYSVLFAIPFALLSQQSGFLNSDFLSPQTTETFQSEIVVDAPTQTIWAQTLDIAPVQKNERIWTVSHSILGAPQPIDARLKGDIRDLRWTKGVRFQEHITTSVANRFLEWRFVFHRPETLAAIDPNIHPQSRTLFLEKGSYHLIPEPDGRTRVILTTTYHMKTPINGYLRFWGALFLNDFQSSVLAVIKARSEAAA